MSYFHFGKELLLFRCFLFYLEGVAKFVDCIFILKGLLNSSIIFLS